MTPTIAPKPILYVAEQASAATFTCSEPPPNAANNTVKISAKNRQCSHRTEDQLEAGR
jgi:hypothetical protein